MHVQYPQMLEDIYLHSDTDCIVIPEVFHVRNQSVGRNFGPASRQIDLAINDTSAPVQEVHGVNAVLPETVHFQQMLHRMGFLDSQREFLSVWDIGAFVVDRRHTFLIVSQPFVQRLDKFEGKQNGNPNRGWDTRSWIAG